MPEFAATGAPSDERTRPRRPHRGGLARPPPRRLRARRLPAAGAPAPRRKRSRRGTRSGLPPPGRRARERRAALLALVDGVGRVGPRGPRRRRDSRVLRAMEAEGGLVGVAKVIAAMEDVPARTFAAWSFKALDVGGGKFVELGPEGPAAILGDTVIGLLKVGKVVGAMERARRRGDARQLVDRVRRRRRARERARPADHRQRGRALAGPTSSPSTTRRPTSSSRARASAGPTRRCATERERRASCGGSTSSR